MGRHWVSVVAASCFALLAAGCASMSTVKNADLDDATTKTFDASYDATNVAAVTALQLMKINITSSKEDAKGTTYLLSKSMTMFSWGEVGRVVVGKSGDGKTPVFVNWEKRSQMQITGTGESSFSRDLFGRITSNLRSSVAKVLGTGTVKSVLSTTADNGESSGDRVAIGLLSGGLAGAAMGASTEEDLGTSYLKQYVIDMAQGADMTANSFSHVEAGECVKVSRVSGASEVILERVEASAGQAAACGS